MALKPVYDYACDTCQVVEERSHAMNDETPQVHACGAVMRRVITTFPTLFYPGRVIGERDGWYWDPFPKMQSVRAEDKHFNGVTFAKDET